MNRLPVPSVITLYGLFNDALVAAPPSPLKLAGPLPATVMIFPVALTISRIRLLARSAMNRLPALSIVRPIGTDNFAAVAAAPSPLKPAVPLPATVTMFPVALTISRMRLLAWSAINKLPLASKATPFGPKSEAALAALPSPE